MLQQYMNRQQKSRIPVLSFFTGGGFLDMGFEKAGFEIVWTNEVEPAFIKYYEAGMTSWKRAQGSNDTISISCQQSIRDIESSKIIEKAFGRSGRPPVFGMIGGPPCQDFSSRGNLHGFDGERGPLTDAYLDKILELQPSFFVMENVTGLLVHSKNANHFLTLLELVEEEYHVDILKLNSLHYGVPQYRERIFVIGIHKNYTENIQPDFKRRNWFPHPYSAQFFSAESRFQWPKAQAFTGKSNFKKPDNLPMQLCVESCLVSSADEKKVPNAKERFNLLGDLQRFDDIGEGETNRPSFKRLHRYKYSPTACYGNNEVHLHPYKHQRLSVRETLRVQGVEDSYILCNGPLGKKFKMIGNGVPVPLAQALASTLASFLENSRESVKWTSGQRKSVAQL